MAQRTINKGKSCAVESCVQSAYCKGYCHRHYDKQRRHGDPLYTPTRPKIQRKRCNSCGEVKPRSQFFSQSKSRSENLRSLCKPCYSERQRWRNLHRKYGITREQFMQMLLEQDHACAVCGEELPLDDMDVDHCHRTGAVRGILHRRCNLLLGAAQDSIYVLRSAIAYLERAA